MTSERVGAVLKSGRNLLLLLRLLLALLSLLLSQLRYPCCSAGRCCCYSRCTLLLRKAMCVARYRHPSHPLSASLRTHVSVDRLSDSAFR